MELGAAALIGMGLCAAGFAGAAVGIGFIFAQTIETVGRQPNAEARIAKYCYDLAVAFSSFYEHVNVLKADTSELINARLCLVLSFKSTLERALGLLGITAPQRM